jgi:hypothetical protein
MAGRAVHEWYLEYSNTWRRLCARCPYGGDSIRAFVPYSWMAGRAVHEWDLEYSNSWLRIVPGVRITATLFVSYSWMAGRAVHEWDLEYSNGARR